MMRLTTGSSIRMRRALLLGTTSLGCLVAPLQLHAQDTTPQAEETQEEELAQAVDENTIVVTGIRQALEDAAAIKRNADTFVDSITASDVATLPDLSVAEALGRIPGLTVTRFNTANPDFPSPEGSGNLIRGLGFIRSEFNGRDAFTANGGRALDWSSVPPELVGGIDVYKNQTADLIEGGIGGTINLRTLEPFERQGLFAAAIVDYTYSDLRKEWSPNFSGLIDNSWDTGLGRFGVLVSASRSELKSRINGWQQSAPIPRRGLAATPEAEAVPSTGAFYGDIFEGFPADQTIGIRPGFQMRMNDVDRVRDSLYGALQWENDNLEVMLKYIYVDNESESVENTTEWFPSYGNGQRLAISDLTLDEDWSSEGVPLCGPEAPGENVAACEPLIPIQGGLMESGLVTAQYDSWYGAYGVDVTNLGIGKRENSQTEDISINIKWDATEQLFFEFDAHKTTAKADFQELWGGTRFFSQVFVVPDLDSPSVEFTFDPRLNPATINPDTGQPYSGYTSFADPDGASKWAFPTSTTDPNSTYWLFAADSFREGTGDLYAIRGDVTYEFLDDGWFDGVKFGVRHSERSQNNKVADLNWASVSPPWAGGLGFVGMFDTPATEEVDFSDFYRGGVVQGDNDTFLYIDSELLLDYGAFIDYLANEPDIALNPVDGSADAVDWNNRREPDGTISFLPDTISDITEETQNAYVRLDFGNEFDNGMSLDGNIGLRYARTKVSSEGFAAFVAFTPDVVEPVFDPATGERLRTDDAELRDNPRDFLPETVAYVGQSSTAQSLDTEYEYWLPSVNLKWNLNSEMLVRFGASRGLSRPNVQDLRAGQTYRAGTTRSSFPGIEDPQDPLFGVDRGAQNISLTEIRINGGNPNLLPTTAINFDLSYEYYFPTGYFSAAVFYKELKNIVVGGSEVVGQVTLDGQTVPIQYSGRSTRIQQASRASRLPSRNSSTPCRVSWLIPASRRTTPISTLRRSRPKAASMPTATVFRTISAASSASGWTTCSGNHRTSPISLASTRTRRSSSGPPITGATGTCSPTGTTSLETRFSTRLPGSWTFRSSIISTRISSSAARLPMCLIRRARRNSRSTRVVSSATGSAS